MWPVYPLDPAASALQEYAFHLLAETNSRNAAYLEWRTARYKLKRKHAQCPQVHQFCMCPPFHLFWRKIIKSTA